ncbi:MAG: lamin tail domain-containing protein, partial [Candidatus Marinimicrobia bacterium]|nr:lamin tail domain-containing protein [Candidatus Neomarinimicrobiota bacterium]
SVPPQSYALIFEGDYSFSAGIYADSIPNDVILIKVDDSSIGNGLSTSDSLYLMDSTGIVTDSLGWSDIAPDGFSLEKVRLALSNSPGNWEVSRDSLGSPGQVNSVLPFTIDGKLLTDSLTVTPDVVSSSELVTLNGKVMNDGTQTISGEIIISSSGIDLENIDVSNLAELDTSDFETTLGPFTSGSHSISVHFQVSGDEDTTNNVGTVSAGVRFSEGAVTINEFMPQPSSGLTEFVEVINQSGKSVDMENWRIADAVDGSDYRFPDFILPSGNYAVIADDSSLLSFVPDSVAYIVPYAGFPTLNNSTDEIRIFDPFGTRIDSFSYDSDFGYASGISSEKIFPDSSSTNASHWSSSVDQNGMTPGTINSVTPRYIDGSIVSSALLYAPLPPSANDSVTFSIPVRNDGLQQISGNVIISENFNEIGMGSFANLSSFDTSLISVAVPPFESGESFVSITLSVIGDMDSTDNSAEDTVYVRFPFETVQINEFMAMPNNDQA